MRRALFSFLSILVGIVLILANFGSVFAMQAPSGKVDVCHATSSETNPYVLINVSVASVADWTGKNGHGTHEDDAWPAFYAKDGAYIAAQGDMSLCDEAPTATATLTPVFTLTSTATVTLEPTATNTETPDPTATGTAIPTEIPTGTPIIILTATPTNTNTPTVLPTGTEIIILTPTNTLTPVPTMVTTATATLTSPATVTLEPTLSATPSTNTPEVQPTATSDHDSCAEIWAMTGNQRENHQKLFDNNCDWYVTRTPVWSNTGSGGTDNSIPAGNILLFGLGVLCTVIGIVLWITRGKREE